MGEYDPEDVRATRNSRGEGIVLLLGGLVMVAVVGVYEVRSIRLTAALAGLGAMAIMMGLGMIVAPWSEHLLEADRQGDADAWFKALPLGWKVWFCLSLLVSFGLLIGLLITLGSAR